MALVSLLYSTVYVPVTVKEKSINVSTTGEIRTMEHFFQSASVNDFDATESYLHMQGFIYDSMQ